MTIPSQSNRWHSPMLSRRAWMAACLMGMSGCSSWYHIKDSTKKPEGVLPPPRLPEDSATVDIAFLRLSDVPESELNEAWSLINEQAIDIDIRRRLDSNGIRAGVIAGTVPLPVQRWLNVSEEKLKTDFLEQANIAADASSQRQRVVCRDGKRKELVVRPQKPGQLVIMHSSQGVAKGKTYDEPMLMLELKVQPFPDGSARIQLTPEVQHGPQITSHFASAGDFHVQRSRAQDIIKESCVDVRLQPLNILMITGTVEPRALGEHFFWTDTVHQIRERVAMLVRLTGNQTDDLFSPNTAKAQPGS